MVVGFGHIVGELGEARVRRMAIGRALQASGIQGTSPPLDDEHCIGRHSRLDETFRRSMKPIIQQVRPGPGSDAPAARSANEPLIFFTPGAVDDASAARPQYGFEQRLDRSGGTDQGKGQAYSSWARCSGSVVDIISVGMHQGRASSMELAFSVRLRCQRLRLNLSGSRASLMLRLHALRHGEQINRHPSGTQDSFEHDSREDGETASHGSRSTRRRGIRQTRDDDSLAVIPGQPATKSSARARQRGETVILFGFDTASETASPG